MRKLKEVMRLQFELHLGYQVVQSTPELDPSTKAVSGKARGRAPE